jgi:hypothetical protein
LKGPNDQMDLPANPVSNSVPLNPIVCRSTRCPAYDDRLRQWLASDEFKAKEAETQQLRNRVQALAPQFNVSCSLQLQGR